MTLEKFKKKYRKQLKKLDAMTSELSGIELLAYHEVYDREYRGFHELADHLEEVSKSDREKVIRAFKKRRKSIKSAFNQYREERRKLNETESKENQCSCDNDQSQSKEEDATDPHCANYNISCD